MEEREGEPEERGGGCPLGPETGRSPISLCCHNPLPIVRVIATSIGAHMGSEGRLYSSKSTNGGKGLQNSKINSYFTP